MDKERLRKLKIFENARTQVENRIFECDPNGFSTEEIELALEYLVIAIPKLKKLWDDNLSKVSEDL